LKKKYSQVNFYPSSFFALSGVCIYIASLAFPFQLRWDIPLLLLAIISILSIIPHILNKSYISLPFIIPISVFLFVTVLSILASEDVGRSIQMTVPIIPALLLFFLIAGCFKGTRDIRFLYFTFSFVALLLSAMLLWAFWKNTDMGPFFWVSKLQNPVLVVKNDVTFFAVIAPFSLALLLRRPLSIFGLVAILSILLSIVVIGVFQSRVAMLALIVSFTCFFSLFRPKIGFACGLCVLILILLIDALMGFPLVGRYIHHWDGTGRIPLWLSAWEMFLDAPILGKGPHTFVVFYNSYLHNLNLPSWLFVDPRVIPWAHNLYLEILSEQGIVGFVAFGFLLVHVLSKARKFRSTTSNEVRILGYGALSALVSFCFAAIFELTFLRLWVIITLFAILGIMGELLSFLEQREGV